MLDLPNATDLLVAVDTEGSGLHPDDGARLSIVQLAWDGGSLVLPFDQGAYTWLGPKAWPRKFKPSLWDESDMNYGMAEWEQLVEWLIAQRLIFHNAKHDLTQFAAGLRNHPETGIDLSPSYWWDSMVVAPLLWPNERVSLDHIAQVQFGIGKEHVASLKAWRDKNLGKDKGRYDLIPPDLMIPYAKQDPEITLRLFHEQVELIEQGAVPWEAVDREIDLVIVLYHMERAGVPFDGDGCLVEDRKLAELERRYEQRFAEKIGIAHPTEDNMREYWFHTLDVHPIETTEGGKPQVSAAVVRELVAQGIPGAATWQNLVKTRTARKMWYSSWPAMAGADGRLRTVFRQTKMDADHHGDTDGQAGTKSSRLAVGRIQLQAIPHDYQIPPGIVPVRSFFRAPAGKVLVEIDVSQAEMRGVAGLAKCTGMIERFKAGIDAHSATCQLVFSLDKDDDGWDFHRNLSKRLNFAIVYGGGIDVLVRQIKIFTGVDVTPEQAKEWWQDAKRAMPEIFRYSRQLTEIAERTRRVELVGGKTRHLAWHEFPHKAMNAKIQGSVAVAMADAMIKIHLAFGPGVMLLQIHDSVLLELPVERWQEMTVQAQQIICDTFEGYFHVPFLSDSKTWGSAA